ncbi:MAG: hypothetical protein HY815_02020, partial [Candidatus Riflebacteria bacterium]|nr:hypothetical protein [Candidatus Riflebacteria bacterium]
MLWLAFVAIGLWPGDARAAQLDDLQSRLLAQFVLPQRWDNAEGGREWVSGPRPEREAGLHCVRLAPGEAVVVKARAASALRLLDPREPLHPGDVEVSVSNSSALFVQRPAHPFTDGRSLVATADSLDGVLFRIALSSTASRARRIALFTARYEPVGQVAPYRGLVELAAPRVRIRRS